MTEETRFQSIDEVFDDMYHHIPNPDPSRRAEARQAVLAHVDARLAGQVSTFRDTGSPESRPSGLTNWFSDFVDTFMRQRRVMVMLEIIVAIILAGTALIGGVAVAADGAGPGDPLYGVDRTVENIRGSLIFNEDAQANYQAQLATERLMEAQDDEYRGEALDELNEAIVVLTELLNSGTLSQDAQAGLEATLTDLTAQLDSLDSGIDDGNNSAGEDDSFDDESGIDVEDSSSSDQSNTGNNTSSSGDDSSTSGEDSSPGDDSGTSSEDSNSDSEDDSSDEGDDSDDEDDDSSSIDGSLGVITNNAATDSSTNTGNTVDSSPSPDTGGGNSGSDSSDDHNDDHDDHHEDDHDDEGDDD